MMIQLKPSNSCNVSYDYNFQRASTAYDSKGRISKVNRPRFEQGKFGNGVYIEEGTNNLIPPSVQEFAGWSRNAGSTSTVTTDIEMPEWGTTRASRVQVTGGTSIVKFYRGVIDSAPAAGEVYSASVKVKNIGTKAMAVNSNLGSRNVVIQPGEVAYVTLENCVGNGSTFMQIQFRTMDVEDSLDFIAYQPQAELKAYSTSFTTDTRNTETLRISQSAGLEEGKPFSIELWAKIDKTQTSTYHMLLGSWTKFYLAMFGNSPVLSWTDSDNVQKSASGTAIANPTDWHHWALVHDGLNAIVYVDGVARVTTPTALPRMFNSAGIHIGSLSLTGTTYQFNGLFDDLRISNKARTAAEVLSLYQSNTPAPADANTTYKQDFNGSWCPHGKGRYLTKGNFSRSSLAWQDGQLVLPNVPRLETGKFGNGIMIEEGTTNSWNNGGWMDGSLTGWTSYSAAGGSGTRQVVDDLNYTRAMELSKLDGSTANAGRFGLSQSSTWSSVGATLTDTLYFKVISASAGARLTMYSDYRLVDGSNYFGSGFDVDLTTLSVTKAMGTVQLTAESDGWYKIVFTTASASVSYGPSYIWISSNNAVVRLARTQKEAKTYATSFTPDTRINESLTIQTAGVLNPAEGQIDVWVCVNAMARRFEGNYNRIFSVNSSTGATGITLLHRPDNATWQIQTRGDDGSSTLMSTASDSLTPDGWHLFSVKWSSAEAVLLIDGIRRAFAVDPKLPSAFVPTLSIGSSYTSGISYLNTIFDDIRISSRARTDAEILAAYQANAPLSVDADTTYKMDFDTDVTVYKRKANRV
ncbi:LamG domain-containing protein [Paenibacillus eucommiae]|uniref:LamG domain-containing protein n=1 Tax=Paenibacillus eucommiae TaxID=1355755 RepID=A0ABS4IRJ9_9BACL|nr:LamG domain-containing protein [Paenibacillus eucommiae]MBP1990199.1 hypothetical protein [Paenibacillus eucommiae]